MNTILKNFWCQVLVQSTHSGRMMLHLGGFMEISMLNALERISRKSHVDLKIKEHSPTHWTATCQRTATKYVVEMRDDEPVVDRAGKIFSYHNQTQQPPEKPRKLSQWFEKKPPSNQMDLF